VATLRSRSWPDGPAPHPPGLERRRRR